jgi:hypothetical protein
MGLTYECTVDGYRGKVEFPKFDWATYRTWIKYVQKGHKRDVLEVRKQGIEVDEDDIKVFVDFWSSALVVSNWDVLKVDGNKELPIPAPLAGQHPEQWLSADGQQVDFAVFQWFRRAANDCITPQIAPNV